MEPRSETATAILALLTARGEGLTICPSEAARRVAGSSWRDAMPGAHAAARDLVAQGEVVLTQGGVVVPPGRGCGRLSHPPGVMRTLVRAKDLRR